MKIFCVLLFAAMFHFSPAQQPVLPDNNEQSKPDFEIPTFVSTVYDSSMTGYYFMIIKKYMVIIDHAGGVVYFAPSGPLGADFFLAPNAWMCYSNPLKFYFLDSTFHKVDSISCQNNVITDFHEMLIMPNGHFLMLGVDSFTKDLSRFQWKGKYGSDTASIRCAVIQELDTNRNVVFEWHAKDHFEITDIDTTYINSMKLVDWTHANALEIDSDGNILLSSRNLNEITKISRKDGSIMWRWGGNRNQFKFINCPVPFYGQHDIRRLGNGHYTLFDNGLHGTSHGARAMEFELDQENKVATLIWSYTPDSALYSKARGSVQRILDSITVISLGENEKKECFVVVNNKNKKYLEVEGLHPYRVIYYSSLPWQLHRPEISCFDSSGITYLDAGAGYRSYHWNIGDTTRIVRVFSDGNYYVFVPYGEDGYISSNTFTIDDISHPCGISSTEEKRRNKK